MNPTLPIPVPIPIPKDKLLDLLLDVVCVVNKEGRFLWVSAASERVFGYRPEEMIGRTAFDMMHPDDREPIRSLVERINNGEPAPDHENRYFHKDGHIVHIMWATQWLEAEQVRVGVARDITGRKRAEAVQKALFGISEAAHSDGDLQVLFRRVHEVVGELLCAETFYVAFYDRGRDQLSFPYRVDPFGASSPSPVPLASDRLTAQVIRSGEALILAPDAASVTGPEAEPEPRGWLGVPLLSIGKTLGALVVRNDSGTRPYSPQDRELLQFAASQIAAAIERRHNHTRLEYLAQYDALTELPNRSLFRDRLRNALKKSQRDGTRLAVIYLDLDRFKHINDSHGHTTGDQLLQEVARRLRVSVRESDTVSRLGGDEFVVLLDSINRQEDAAVVAEKILASLSAPYILEGVTLQSAPSLGIAVYPEQGQDDQQLVRQADAAMYLAKRSGGKCYQFAPPILVGDEVQDVIDLGERSHSQP
ncbi:MAG: diguanylate cyclase [Oleiphilaceae bacterium]|nr:diguanylate cyclase [Oleiphilaceae bacterium]